MRRLPRRALRTLNVPLDRAGVDPGSINLRIGRIGKSSRPTLMYLSGGPGGAGLSEMLSVISGLPQLEDRFQLIGYDQRGTGRSGLLRCPRLERDPHLRSTAAAEDCANRLGVARHHYTTADSVQDMEAIRTELGVEKLTLFGISYGTELAIAYARAYPQHVERLILDSVVDADDTDPYLTATFRAMGPSLRSLCPGHCAGISADPGADLKTLVARLRAKPMVERAYDANGRSHKVTIGPLDLFDLMLVTDYLPPLRAIVPTAVRSALAGDGALLARIVRDSSAFDVLGSPRDFSVARYSTVCETSPMPWDPGTPIEQRPAVVQQRIGALPADAFAPFDPPTVVGDEIDLCLRWPDVPRPPSTAAAAAVSDGPDPDPPGRGGSADAAGGLRPDRGADPGLGPARRPRDRALDDQRPAHLRRRRDPEVRPRGDAAEALQADPDRHPGRRRRPGLVRRPEGPRRRAEAGRSHRAGAGGDARRPPARALAGRAGDVRRRPARRLVDDPWESAGTAQLCRCQRGDRERPRQQPAHAARLGRQGGAWNGRTSLGWAPFRDSRRTPDLGAPRRTAGERGTRVKSAEVGALTYRHLVTLPT